MIKLAESRGALREMMFHNMKVSRGCGTMPGELRFPSAVLKQNPLATCHEPSGVLVSHPTQTGCLAILYGYGKSRPNSASDAGILRDCETKLNVDLWPNCSMEVQISIKVSCVQGNPADSARSAIRTASIYAATARRKRVKPLSGG
jgi:hypothetical protein